MNLLSQPLPEQPLEPNEEAPLHCFVCGGELYEDDEIVDKSFDQPYFAHKHCLEDE